MNPNKKWIRTTDGEANFYGIATEEDWLMRIQINGEVDVYRQGIIMDIISAAPLLGFIRRIKAFVKKHKANDSFWGTKDDIREGNLIIDEAERILPPGKIDDWRAGSIKSTTIGIYEDLITFLIDVV